MLYTLRARQFVQLRGYNLPEYRIIYDLKWLHGHATLESVHVPIPTLHFTFLTFFNGSSSCCLLKDNKEFRLALRVEEVH